MILYLVDIFSELIKGSSNMSNDSLKITAIAEFSSPELEKDYCQDEISHSIKYVQYVILLIGSMFLIMAAFDLIRYGIFDVYLLSSVTSFIVFSTSVALFFTISRIKDSRMVMVTITLFELFTFFAYMYLLYQRQDQNFNIQCMAVMIFIYALFLLPNRWINHVLVSAFFVAFFFALSSQYILGLTIHDYLQSLILLFFATLFAAVLSYRIGYHRRTQFVRERQLELLSNTDKLTEVYNRQKFDILLGERCDYANRYKSTFSILIFDIDDFKHVNDTYGHLTGDRVLIDIAKLVKGRIRGDDVFARWGGEEFIILLPNTPLRFAAELAERIRVSMESFAFDEVGRVTCSFGVATHHENDTPGKLVERADQLLYIAKHSGKNTVVPEQQNAASEPQ